MLLKTVRLASMLFGKRFADGAASEIISTERLRRDRQNASGTISSLQGGGPVPTRGASTPARSCPKLKIKQMNYADELAGGKGGEQRRRYFVDILLTHRERYKESEDTIALLVNRNPYPNSVFFV